MKKRTAAVILILYLVVVTVFTGCTKTSLGSVGSSGWDRETGEGSAMQLDAALSAVKNAGIGIQEEYTSETAAVENIAEALRSVLEDYDVFVDNITITREGYWDGYDENGQFFYGNKLCDVEIILTAGQDVRTVHKSIPFGVKRSSSPTPVG